MVRQGIRTTTGQWETRMPTLVTHTLLQHSSSSKPYHPAISCNPWPVVPNLSAASKVKHQHPRLLFAASPSYTHHAAHHATHHHPKTQLSQQTLTACGRRLRCCLCLRRCCACSAAAGPAAGRWWPPHCWYPDPPSWTETQTAAAAAAGAKCPVDRLPLTALQHLHTQQQHHYSSVHCTR